MLPTSPLPVTPLMAPSGMVLLVGVLAVGGLVALVIGYVVHRRAERLAPRVDVADGAAEAQSRRLSA